MQRLSKAGEQGFTLIELLIAMVISLIMIGAIARAFVSQRMTYAIQEQVTEMNQNARAAMDTMTREIRMAGFDPLGILQKDDPSEAGGTPFVGIPYDSTQLEIVADIGDGSGGTGDGNTDDPYEDITYSYDSANLQIDRDTSALGNNPQPFAENIQVFTFAYLDEGGNATTDTAEIRQIEITITARTAKLDPNYSHPTYSDGYRRYTLTSVVTPINLAL
jgi:type IV pilus assembly protein PilW